MNPNALLTGIERARLWNYFHKDWLLQIRAALRPQLSSEYHVFVESEAILIAPEDDEPATVTLPDVAVARRDAAVPGTVAQAMMLGTVAVLEVDEPCELETRYSLVIRRAADHRVTAVCEMVSPSNKGLGNRFDREKHLRKRERLIEAGVSLLEIDALLRGDPILPDALDDLSRFSRTAWTAYYEDGIRKWRGWGWNESDPLPAIPWRVDVEAVCTVDLAATCNEACEFNSWEQMVDLD